MELIQIQRPSDLGLPERYEDFRPVQLEALEFTEESQKRFIATNLKVGSGKSLLALSIAKRMGRTAILTSTKGLMSQYYRDYAESGLVQIKGKSNYSCPQYRDCETGAHSGCNEGDFCDYRQHYRQALDADMIVTNYAYWLGVNNQAQGLTAQDEDARDFDCLILDEAHAAVDELSSYLDFSITDNDVEAFGLDSIKTNADSLSDWQSWAMASISKLQAFQPDLKAGKLKIARQKRHRDLLLDRCKTIAGLSLDNWTIEMELGTKFGRSAHFNCIWPGQYREKLFQNIPKIVLMSGTITPKSLSYLGIKQSDCDYREWPYQFPKNRAPFYYIPTVQVKYGITEENLATWLARIDEIISGRLGRKGIIHTGSYARQKYILQNSQYAFHMLANFGDPGSETTDEVVSKFKASLAPKILVSPSITTGYDFPASDAEWQILTKIPFPPMTSKVMKARKVQDPNYQTYCAALDLAQASGRIVRSEVDRGESFLIDDQWKWFQRSAKPYLPAGFSAIELITVPPPGKRWNE